MARSDKKFNAGYLKIDRAKHHVSDLSRKITAFLAQDPFELVTRGDTNTGEITHSIIEQEPIPDELSLIIGDAIHNLRCSLDMTIFAMIGEIAPKPDLVQFPFCRRPESLDDEIKKRQIHLAGERVVDAIKALKPHPGGHGGLEAIHALDVRDKHKLILTTRSNALISGAEFNVLIPGMEAPRDAPIYIEHGTVFRLSNALDPVFAEEARKRNFSGFRYKSDVKPPFEIHFDSSMWIEPLGPVVPFLIEHARYVEAVIDYLISAYNVAK